MRSSSADCCRVRTVHCISRREETGSMRLLRNDYNMKIVDVSAFLLAMLRSVATCRSPSCLILIATQD